MDRFDAIPVSGSVTECPHNPELACGRVFPDIGDLHPELRPAIDYRDMGLV